MLRIFYFFFTWFTKLSNKEVILWNNGETEIEKDVQLSIMYNTDESWLDASKMTIWYEGYQIKRHKHVF